MNVSEPCHLHLDFETYSTVDIRRVTTPYYVSHPDTEILMLGWAVNSDPVELWEYWQPFPTSLRALMQDPDVTLHAFNAPFERGLLKHKMGIDTPISRWRDTQVESLAQSFPAKLNAVLKAIGLEPKDARGERLINIFSKPAPKSHKADRYDRHNRPDDWRDFCEYCRQDVKVERDLHRWLEPYNAISEEEWRLWYLDQKINDKGIPVDVKMAEGALDIWHRVLSEIKTELSQIVGLGKVTRGPFLQWLEEQGCPLPNTQRETIQTALKDPLPPHVFRALTLWSHKEARAIDKYKAILGTHQSGRIYGLFQFMGASRTRRWAGRVVQPHNLKRTIPPFSKDPDQIDVLAEVIRRKDLSALKMFWPGIPVSELLGSAVRHTICAEDGKVLVAGDLGSIESRVLGWFTGCQRINRVFAEGKDTYNDFATSYFGVPYDLVTKEQRTFSKPPVLGAGYGLGWRGMIAYAENYGVTLDEEKSRRMVTLFREGYPEIPAFWTWVDGAIKYVVTTGTQVSGYRFTIYKYGEFLCIWLPSGRALWYYKPEIRMHKTPWGELKPTFSYMGVDDKTQWVRLFVHPGLITENCTQALARDFLAYGMQQFDKAGWDTCLHVHDEDVSEVESTAGKEALHSLIHCLTLSPPWAPDILLGADGYIAKRYRKD